jgi:hypothetical protein
VLTVLAPRRVLLPFYVCDAVLEPITTLGLSYRFYGLARDLDPLEGLRCGSGEVALYVNYFGLKGATARRLSGRLKSALIVDDTQAFYERGYPGSWSFNSARKFFGVPDGAYLYSPRRLPPPVTRNEAPSWDHLIGRLSDRLADAFKSFQASEAAITSEMRGISVAAERLLAGIDYGGIAARRRENFLAYEANLGGVNGRQLPLPADAIPLCYPFLPPLPVSRAALAEQNIYTPTYWHECEARDPTGFSWERHLSGRLLALPVDQRYDLQDVARVVKVVRELMER